MNKLTVFTPTYNRGYIIGKLYESLLKQTVHDFEWLVIDDGSTDNTKDIITKMMNEDCPFLIRYYFVENGGKQRAINEAVKIIDSEYVFIVDSDDILVNTTIEKILLWINDSDLDDTFAGVSGLKGDMDKRPLKGIPSFQGDYIDCTNLQRKQFNLSADMAEVYKTKILKQYPFVVWPNEKFVPEALVWDAIAEDGYKLRWHKDVIYLCSYLDDGLTKGSWKLLRDNPMGYARLFEHNANLSNNKRAKLKNIMQMDSCLILAKELKYLRKSNNSFYGLILLPFGYLLSCRRKKQFIKYINNI